MRVALQWPIIHVSNKSRGYRSLPRIAIPKLVLNGNQWDTTLTLTRLAVGGAVRVRGSRGYDEAILA